MLPPLSPHTFAPYGDSRSTPPGQRFKRLARAFALTAIAGLVQTVSAVGPAGQAKAWGDYSYGGIGDGTTVAHLTPVAVAGADGGPTLTGVVDISAGAFTGVALLTDGTAVAWGIGQYGSNGDGDQGQNPTPKAVVGLTNAVAVSSGDFHTLALKQDGTLMAWGFNHVGQVGDGTSTFRTTAVTIPNLTNIIAIDAGGFQSLALKSDGTVISFGNNQWGQQGNNSYTHAYTPTAVAGLSGIVAISSGYGHNLALQDDGTVWAWGYNNKGQIGNGTTNNQLTPIKVKNATGTGDLTNVILVHAGYESSLALLADGSVQAWGNNNYGQLGDGTVTPTPRTLPGVIPGLTDVVAFSGHQQFNMALKLDGTVWAWGRNSSGQLGNGTVTNRSTPTQVVDLVDVADIASGAYRGLAIGDALPPPPLDSDGDGVPDDSDLYPNNPDEWADANNNGIGDNLDATVAQQTDLIAALQSDKTALEVSLAHCADAEAVQAGVIAALESDLAAADTSIAALNADLATTAATLAATTTDLNDALATITQLNAALANAMTDVDVLNGSLNAVQAALDRFVAAFQAEFDVTFALTGTTPAEQTDALVSAINALNHGQQQALFKALSPAPAMKSVKSDKSDKSQKGGKSKK